MKIAHISDTHFANQRLDEKIRCAHQVLEIINNEKPDLIVHAGDVFNAPIRMEDPGARAACDFFAGLLDIAPVLVNKGNEQHDRSSVEILPFVRGKHEFHLSTQPEMIGFTVDRSSGGRMRVFALEEAVKNEAWGYDAVFSTMPYPSSSFLAKTSRLGPSEMTAAVSAAITETIKLGAALNISAGVAKILVFHGTVTGALYSETQQELGMDIQLSPFDIGACGFDLTCAGHLHHKQQIATSSGSIYYPGGLSCLHYGDEPPKGIWIHESTVRSWQVLVDSRYLAVDTIPMRSFDVNLIEAPFIDPPAWAQDAMELQIRAKLTEAQREELALIDWKAMFPNAKSIAVLPIVEPVASVRCDEVRQAKTLRDKVVAFGQHANLETTPALLQKTDLLESMDANALITAAKERFA